MAAPKESGAQSEAAYFTLKGQQGDEAVIAENIQKAQQDESQRINGRRS